MRRRAWVGILVLLAVVCGALLIEVQEDPPRQVPDSGRAGRRPLAGSNGSTRGEGPAVVLAAGEQPAPWDTGGELEESEGWMSAFEFVRFEAGLELQRCKRTARVREAREQLLTAPIREGETEERRAELVEILDREDRPWSGICGAIWSTDAAGGADTGPGSEPGLAP